MESINNQVQSVRQLLAIPQLAIPSYQRPYRWGSKNISDLFTDLATHQDKSAYRLGSVVFHQHTDSEQGEMLDIVDGQQRTLTLMLTVKALIEVLDNENRSGKEKSIRFQRQDLREQLQVLRGPIDAFMQRVADINDLITFIFQPGIDRALDHNTHGRQQDDDH